MKTVSVAQLQQDPIPALDDVQTGEVYTVTEHHRPVARLSPVDDDSVTIIPAKHPGKYRLADQHQWPHLTRAEIDALLKDMDQNR